MLRSFRDNPVYAVLLILIGALIASCFIVTPTFELASLVFSKATLIKDYIAFSGFFTAFLNVILVMIFVLAIMIKCKIETNGLTIAALMTVLGFAFFGKNIYNILWIFLGVYLYSRTQHIPFKNYFNVALFATALAPLVTTGVELGWFPLIVGHILAVVYGFIIAPIASHAPRFHNGYTLYNIGFSGGVVAIIFASVLKQFKNELPIVVNVSTDMTIHWILVALTVVISLTLIIMGLLQSDFSMKQYKLLLSQSGHGASDFYTLYGRGASYVNMGLIGLILLVVCLLTRVPLNGASFGSMMSALGFGAFGKHPRNIIPVIFGAVLMIIITGSTITAGTIITLVFVTGLAPVAGDFGMLVGILAGMLHYSLVSYAAPWQGGINLYNNGFASGFIAALVSSLALHQRANQHKEQHIQKK